jgi:hypothetical protein
MQSGDKYRAYDGPHRVVTIIRCTEFEDILSYYTMVEFEIPEGSIPGAERMMDQESFLEMYESVPDPEVYYYRDTQNGSVVRATESSFRSFENSSNHERVNVSTYSEDED